MNNSRRRRHAIQLGLRREVGGAIELPGQLGNAPTSTVTFFGKLYRVRVRREGRSFSPHLHVAGGGSKVQLGGVEEAVQKLFREEVWLVSGTTPHGKHHTEL